MALIFHWNPIKHVCATLKNNDVRISALGFSSPNGYCVHRFRVKRETLNHSRTTLRSWTEFPWYLGILECLGILYSLCLFGLPSFKCLLVFIIRGIRAWSTLPLNGIIIIIPKMTKPSSAQLHQRYICTNGCYIVVRKQLTWVNVLKTQTNTPYYIRLRFATIIQFEWIIRLLV